MAEKQDLGLGRNLRPGCELLAVLFAVSPALQVAGVGFDTPVLCDPCVVLVPGGVPQPGVHSALPTSMAMHTGNSWSRILLIAPGGGTRMQSVRMRWVNLIKACTDPFT